MIKISQAAQQITEAFDRLPAEEKIRLVEAFERKTRKERWSALTKTIRARFKRNPLSQSKIDRICSNVRKALYEQRHKSRR